MTTLSVVPLPSPRPWSVAMRTSSGPATVHKVTAEMNPSAAQIVRRNGSGELDRAAQHRGRLGPVEPVLLADRAGRPHQRSPSRRHRRPRRAARARRRSLRRRDERRDALAVLVPLHVVTLRPRGEHVAVAGARGEQLVVRAASGDTPSVEQHHARGESDRAGAVGDDDRRATVHDRGHRLADLVLLRRVDGAGGVVEHEHPGIDEDRPGDGDALALTAAQREATLADQRLVPVGQRVDELGRAGEPGGPLDLVQRRVRPGEGDVAADGVVEQERVLEHDGDGAGAGPPARASTARRRRARCGPRRRRRTGSAGGRRWTCRWRSRRPVRRTRRRRCRGRSRRAPAWPGGSRSARRGSARLRAGASRGGGGAVPSRRWPARCGGPRRRASAPLQRAGRRPRSSPGCATGRSAARCTAGTPPPGRSSSPRRSPGDRRCRARRPARGWAAGRAPGGTHCGSAPRRARPAGCRRPRPAVWRPARPRRRSP